VIKVEDDVGDYIRYFQPVAGDGNSAQFHAINRGKVRRHTTIDWLQMCTVMSDKTRTAALILLTLIALLLVTLYRNQSS